MSRVFDGYIGEDVLFTQEVWSSLVGLHGIKLTHGELLDILDSLKAHGIDVTVPRVAIYYGGESVGKFSPQGIGLAVLRFGKEWRTVTHLQIGGLGAYPRRYSNFNPARLVALTPFVYPLTAEDLDELAPMLELYKMNAVAKLRIEQDA